MTRITKRKLREYSHTLSKRDKAVLHSIKMCKYLKTDQVGRLHFGDSPTPSAALRAASRSLAKLRKMGLVQALPRRIGGVRAGSTSYVWTLKMAGVELLQLAEHLHHDEEKPKKRCRKRVHEPTDIFMYHTLAVSELYTRLKTISGIKLAQADFEPVCWRSFTTFYGATTTLKPDLYAVTAYDGYEDYWLFEVDRDTEAPIRITRKCEVYCQYYDTNQEQNQTGVFPRVVWLVPDEKRKKSLCHHISEKVSEYVDLFAVITFDELDGLVAPTTEIGGIGQVGEGINIRNNLIGGVA